ncbi:PD-(D/E)XK nuclease family transposase [Paenibacillus sp. IHBB 3054]|uniref:PD-(D/E)XK nuclease family transposase n=1 Tax=Paenibacillus sp. IHBB 3054 TaxID=3425689 RepID=UPI003F66A461
MQLLFHLENTIKQAFSPEREVLKMNEPGLEKAMDTLQYLSQDSDARRLYEARQKYLHDEASMLGSAKMAGIKKVAKNMLTLNLDIATIAKATGLTEQEINSLRK